MFLNAPKSLGKVSHQRLFFKNRINMIFLNPFSHELGAEIRKRHFTEKKKKIVESSGTRAGPGFNIFIHIQKFEYLGL